MTRRDIFKTAAAAVPALGLTGVAAAAPKRIKNMGVASPGIGARAMAARKAGQQLDLIEYCNEKGLGAAHIYLRGNNSNPEGLKKIYDQINRYDMRITVGLRCPRSDDELPQYDATVKALAAMDGRVDSLLDQFSGRRYEQFKSAAEFHPFFAKCKEAVRRSVPVLEKHNMRLAIENHKGWRSAELVEWIKETGSDKVGACYDMCNNVSLVETPQQTLEALAPYAFQVSFKDIAADFYDEGILLSEVPFGEGYQDLPAVVAQVQKTNPNIIFLLEMITRDPLKVPIFTEQYWKVWDDKSPVPPQDLAMLVDWVRKHPPKKPLPKVSGLTPEERLALEDDYNARCVEYVRANLPTVVG